MATWSSRETMDLAMKTTEDKKDDEGKKPDVINPYELEVKKPDDDGEEKKPDEAEKYDRFVPEGKKPYDDDDSNYDSMDLMAKMETRGRKQEKKKPDVINRFVREGKKPDVEEEHSENTNLKIEEEAQTALKAEEAQRALKAEEAQRALIPSESQSDVAEKYYDRLVVEGKIPYDDEDMFYHESDSDGDEDEDEDPMDPYYKVIESGYHPSIARIDDDEEEVYGRRKCLEVSLCHKYQHDIAFEGEPFFELYKVKLKFNDKSGDTTPLVGIRLHGEIVTNWARSLDKDNPFPISYYSATPDQAHIVNLDSQNHRSTLLPLSGPSIDGRPPMSEDYTFGLKFAFKLDDGTPPMSEDDTFGFKFAFKLDDDDDQDNHVATSDVADYENPLVLKDLLGLRPSSGRSSRTSGAFIARKVMGNPFTDRILMLANYSVCTGAWAAVKVKVLKKGVSSFHGVIMARPCIYVSRIRLLTIPDTDKGHEVDQESGGCIKLTRSVVVVPAYASLIIGAALYDHEKGEVICRGRNYFPAEESGSETKRISYNGVETLEVTVEWNCKLINRMDL